MPITGAVPAARGQAVCMAPSNRLQAGPPILRTHLEGVVLQRPAKGLHTDHGRGCRNAGVRDSSQPGVHAPQADACMVARMAGRSSAC